MTDEAAEYAAECAKALAAKWRGATRDDRRDAVQSALLAVVKAWPRYDAAKASWRTYIAAVVRNSMASSVRAWRRRRARLAPLGDDTPVHPPEDLRGLLASLPLPPELAGLAEMRLAGATMGECMAAFGWSRRRYESEMARLRLVIGDCINGEK